MDLKRIKTDLANVGLRLTPQRLAILKYLAGTGAHPSARQVFDEVREEYPKLSLATVYNTVSLLLRLGHLKVLEVAEKRRLEVNLNPHINLICLKCNKIQDLPSTISLPGAEACQELGFTVSDYRLEYLGLCADCRREEEKNSAGAAIIP